MSKNEVNKREFNWYVIVGGINAGVRAALISTGIAVYASMAFGTLPTWMLWTGSICIALAMELWNTNTIYKECETTFRAEMDKQLEKLSKFYDHVLNNLVKKNVVAPAPVTESTNRVEEVVADVIEAAHKAVPQPA